MSAISAANIWFRFHPFNYYSTIGILSGNCTCSINLSNDDPSLCHLVVNQSSRMTGKINRNGMKINTKKPIHNIIRNLLVAAGVRHLYKLRGTKRNNSAELHKVSGRRMHTEKSVIATQHSCLPFNFQHLDITLMH